MIIMLAGTVMMICSCAWGNSVCLTGRVKQATAMWSLIEEGKKMIPAGFEPATIRVLGECDNQLHHGIVIQTNAGGSA